MASGIINGNPLLVTALGTFDYIKNFLVIFIYAAFFRDFHDFAKLFRILLYIALSLGAIALIQFIWAMGSVYLLGKAVTDNSVYLFSNMPADTIDIAWRYGIFRTQALTYHAYILGLFNLLILTVYLYTAGKGHIRFIIILVSGIIASVSRMAYAGLIFISLLRFFKVRRLIIFVLISIIVITIFSVISDDFSLSAMLHSYLPDNKDAIDNTNVRMSSRYKATEIWMDHPLQGVGPGMFGGVVASKYSSYIYDLYNLANKNYITRIGGIEQFWFQILAEMGLIGSLLFINLIIFLCITLYQSREQTRSQDMKNLFSGLLAFIPCILIYTIGSGINIAPVLFTYCAFVGMGLGSVSKGGRDYGLWGRGYGLCF